MDPNKTKDVHNKKAKQVQCIKYPIYFLTIGGSQYYSYIKILK